MKLFDFGDGRGAVPVVEHANGGGRVALTAYVAPSVYVGRESMVFGFAQVTGHARISGRARVSGINFPGGLSTLIEDEVTVCGDVVIEGCVLLRDVVRISGQARLSGAVQVAHRAAVGECAVIEGDVAIFDSVQVKGSTSIRGLDERIVIRGGRVFEGAAQIARMSDLEPVYSGRRPRKRKVVPVELPPQTVKISVAETGCSGLLAGHGNSAEALRLRHLFGVPFIDGGHETEAEAA